MLLLTLKLFDPLFHSMRAQMVAEYDRIYGPFLSRHTETSTTNNGRLYNFRTPQ